MKLFGSRSRKRLEFSQRIALTVVVFSMAIVLLTIGGNFVLLWNGKTSMEQETIQAISVFGGITATAGTSAYAALAGWRDHSRNKTGVTKSIMGQQNGELP